jgi:hypothetical protein
MDSLLLSYCRARGVCCACMPHQAYAGGQGSRVCPRHEYYTKAEAIWSLSQDDHREMSQTSPGRSSLCVLAPLTVMPSWIKDTALRRLMPSSRTGTRDALVTTMLSPHATQSRSIVASLIDTLFASQPTSIRFGFPWGRGGGRELLVLVLGST